MALLATPPVSRLPNRPMCSTNYDLGALRPDEACYSPAWRRTNRLFSTSDICIGDTAGEQLYRRTRLFAHDYFLERPRSARISPSRLRFRTSPSALSWDNSSTSASESPI